MTNENNYGLAIAVAIIVVILFFGGWYYFIGQAPAELTPTTNIDGPNF